MTVLDEIIEKLPKDAGITSSGYEGANIVLYTKNKTFFLHGGDIIRQLVSEFKKRIELRADDSIRKDEEKTESFEFDRNLIHERYSDNVSNVQSLIDWV